MWHTVLSSRSRSMLRASIAIGLALALAGPALAGTGRVEINQESVTAAGGFPHVLTRTGSYVLTSDLFVASDVGALAFEGAGYATLDLNGFRVEGATDCTSQSCTTGTAIGIDAGPLASVRVSNGIVRGFSGDCVSLGRAGEAEGLLVSGCGRDGVVLGSEGSARANRVLDVGRGGLALATTARFAHNVVARAGLATPARAVEQGRPAAGNCCDDASCSRRGARRYYLTTSLSAGDGALTACDPGFHMASYFEFAEAAGLEYDPGRGQTTDDSGSGPPALGGSLGGSLYWGYVRSGRPFFEADGVSRNCDGWTLSGEPADSLGTMAWIGPPWSLGEYASAFTLGSGWFARFVGFLSGPGGIIPPCIERPVWCVED